MMEEKWIVDERTQTRLLNLVFFPQGGRLREEAFEAQNLVFDNASEIRFVHYTSAESALAILESKSLWMRNTTCMADTAEVNFGLQYLRNYFGDRTRVMRFKTAMDVCAPGVFDKVMLDFNAHLQHRLDLNIYVTSVSEHLPGEDRIGRLSMWRAFGNSPTKVAIILKVPFESDDTDTLGVIFSPVSYEADWEKYCRNFDEIILRLDRTSHWLKTVPPADVATFFTNMLYTQIVCLKHPGFREEREWRAVHSPMHARDILVPEIQCLLGVPQQIYRLPLDKKKHPSLQHMDIYEMLDHIIVGPSQYQLAIAQALTAKLERLGVADAGRKIVLSDIPIRTMS